MTNQTVIKIDKLKVAYEKNIVLSNVNASINEGEITVILGKSGCGKSTLLKSIAGIISPVSGHLSILDHDMAEISDRDRLKLTMQIGVMFQFGALLNSLTVAENIALPLEMHTDLDNEIIDDIVRTRLENVSLLDAYNLHPSELSGGMRKRAALARALALDPKILLCDEPIAGLDPVSASEIDKLFLTLNDKLGITVIIVTHDLLSIKRLNGRLLMLDSGSVLFTGSLGEAYKSKIPQVISFFQPGDFN